MDFGFSEEQLLLQRSARDFLDTECPPAFVRALFDDEAGFSSASHRKMAGLGWTGLLVPEKFGGLGLGVLDMALLLEEMGRAALPGPFLFSSVLATYALMRGGSSAQKKTWLPRLAAGDALASVALLEASDRLDAVGVTLKARQTRDGYRLRGAKMFVPFAPLADLLLVAARTRGKGERGVSLVLVEKDAPGLSMRPLETFDRTRRVYKIKCKDVPVAGFVGERDRGWKLLAELQDLACVALAADSLGGAQKTLDMAVEYTKVREQFGRPIASFQALKHMAAEAISEIEPARSLVWYAAYAFDTRARDASRAASLAKARLGEVYTRTTNTAVQMHGGIGFTWEHDLHVWFKRAKWNEFAFGDAGYHRDRVAKFDGY